MKPRRLPQWKALLIATFILLFLAEVDLVIEQERTQIFAATAQKVGSALIDFAETRAQLLRRKTNESFAQYEQRISTENADTQSLYSKLYSLEVARLRDGFARRGLKTPELDEFYLRPGSAIAMREIGRTLFYMGAELRSEHFSAVIEGWWRRPIHLTLLSPSKVEGLACSLGRECHRQCPEVRVAVDTAEMLLSEQPSGSQPTLPCRHPASG